jgi:hypothetical protein
MMICLVYPQMTYLVLIAQSGRPGPLTCTRPWYAPARSLTKPREAPRDEAPRAP